MEPAPAVFVYKPIKYCVTLDPNSSKRLVNISTHSIVGMVCSESQLSFHGKEFKDALATPLSRLVMLPGCIHIWVNTMRGHFSLIT